MLLFQHSPGGQGPGSPVLQVSCTEAGPLHTPAEGDAGGLFLQNLATGSGPTAQRLSPHPIHGAKRPPTSSFHGAWLRWGSGFGSFGHIEPRRLPRHFPLDWGNPDGAKGIKARSVVARSSGCSLAPGATTGRGFVARKPSRTLVAALGVPILGGRGLTWFGFSGKSSCPGWAR